MATKATNFPSGNAATLSMADFNARAKRVAEATAAVAKGDARRPPPNRFRRDTNGGIPAAPKPDKTEG